MKNESNIKYMKFEILERNLKKMCVILLITIFIVQAYIFFSNSKSILLLDKLNFNDGLKVKKIDLIPKYGELMIETNEDDIKDLSISINGQVQSFSSGKIKLFVKKGDCIEINSYLLEKEYDLHMKDINNDIKNIDEIYIKIKNNDKKLFVIDI